MTPGPAISWDDTILPFQLDRPDIRGRVARLDGTLGAILAQHDYPPAVEALVAEITLLTALIGQTIKLRWKLSLQVRGSGAVQMIASDYYAPRAPGEPARIRAYSSFDVDKLDQDAPAFSLIGQGYFGVLIDQGKGTPPYQGITPVTGSSLTACAETYFSQSEQLPTRFALALGKSRLPGKMPQWRAGGVMLQHTPKAMPFAKASASDDADRRQADDDPDPQDSENWRRANILLDTVDELELIGPILRPTDLLVRLFHDEVPRVFDPQAISFGCSCSADRVRQNLQIYSARDIAHMTTDDGVLTADCQFCGAHYEFDPKTLGFEAEEAQGDGS